MSSAGGHHHRSTTRSGHKPFKPRFASKGALKDLSKGKIEGSAKSTRRTPHQQVMNKFDRRNKAKQKRLLNHKDHVKATNVFAGKDGAPRVLAVIALNEALSLHSVVHSLNASVDIEQDVSPNMHVRIDRFKQNFAYVLPDRKLFAVLDACRTADYVLFVLSPEEEVDEIGERLLRSIEGQGVSNVYFSVQGLESIASKRRTQVQASLKSYVLQFFPEQERVFSLDSRQESQNLMRSLCTTTPRGIRWREERSWMLIEDMQWPSDGIAPGSGASTNGELVITGVVRGKNLKADRLIHLSDWGDFQITKVVKAQARRNDDGKGNAMAIDRGSDAMLDRPVPEEQDTLDELAPEEAVMEDIDGVASSMAPTEHRSVLLDTQHFISEEQLEDESNPVPKKLPKGTSKYQAAWYLEDVSDSGSDIDDVEDTLNDLTMDDAEPVPADGTEALRGDTMTDAGPATVSEYPRSEPFEDGDSEDQANDVAAYRAQKKDEAQEHLRFPDEIELNPNVLARERLARYRGLKSLRTSPWDTDEDRPHQPEVWERLLEIHDYKGARASVLRETLAGGVSPGTRVHVYLQAPRSLEHQPRPCGLFSLLKHERKRTAVNASITLSSTSTEPLKSKDELIMQCGPRRFVINPIFSRPGTTPNDVHKLERFVHPGQTAVASVIAPLTWGAAPVLFFKRAAVSADIMTDEPANGDLTLVAHGTMLPPSTTRVVAKRVVLTGEPFKVHRRVATIRYMFFNVEDVAWFRALPLWTNKGRSGSIKDSLGTHGFFKAEFEGKIGMQEAVGVSLYKRAWPKAARAFGVSENSAPVLVE